MARPNTAAARLLAGEREPVRVATTANITLAGLQTIDGVLLVAGDRVLAKDQTDATENGIYEASSGVWYRSGDARATRAINKGVTVAVQSGTANEGKTFAFDTLDPDIGDDEIDIVLYLARDFAEILADLLASALASAGYADYATRAAVEAAPVPGGMSFLQTAGYADPGDHGGALYVRVDEEPEHEFKVRSTDRFLSDGVTVDAADGGWWEGVPVNGEVWPQQFGFTLGDVSGAVLTANDAAVNSMLEYCHSYERVHERGRAVARFTPGYHKGTPGTWKFHTGQVIRGSGMYATEIVPAASAGSVFSRKSADMTWTHPELPGTIDVEDDSIHHVTIEDMRFVFTANSQVMVDFLNTDRAKVRRCKITNRTVYVEMTASPAFTTVYTSTKGIRLGGESSATNHNGNGPIVEECVVEFAVTGISIEGPCHGAKILTGEVGDCDTLISQSSHSSSNLVIRSLLLQRCTGLFALDLAGYSGLVDGCYWELSEGGHVLFRSSGATYGDKARGNIIMPNQRYSDDPAGGSTVGLITDQGIGNRYPSAITNLATPFPQWLVAGRESAYWDGRRNPSGSDQTLTPTLSATSTLVFNQLFREAVQGTEETIVTQAVFGSPTGGTIFCPFKGTARFHLDCVLQAVGASPVVVLQLIRTRAAVDSILKRKSLTLTGSAEVQVDWAGEVPVNQQDSLRIAVFVQASAPTDLYMLRTRTGTSEISQIMWAFEGNV